jgi:hypothetical protein
MAILKIARLNEKTNRLRAIKLFVDGVNVGTIANGETKDFEVTASAHEVIAKIDWCTSNQISCVISDKETKLFALNSFAQTNPLGIFAAIYYTSFGRKKYLNLIEIVN